MLTHEEDVRVMSALPSSITKTWKGTDYGTINPTYWWENQDHDIEYPQIELGWNQRGAEREDEQSLNQVLGYNPREGENGYDIKRGNRVYDEMVVKCSVGGHVDDDGVPAAHRARLVAEEVWDYFRYDFDQNSIGPNGERPVLQELVSAPVYAGEQVDGDQSESYQLTVRLHYKDVNVETVDTIDRVEGSIDVSGDGIDIDLS